MKKWFKTIAVALAISLALQLGTSAAFADSVQEALEAKLVTSEDVNQTDGQQTVDNQTPDLTEDLQTLEQTDIDAGAAGGQQEESLPQTPEAQEVQSSDQELSNPTESPSPAGTKAETVSSQKDAQASDPEAEKEEETELLEDTKAEIPDGKGYAGMGYASWLQEQETLARGKNTPILTGQAVLRNTGYQKVMGIDVSEMNTVTDWTKVKASGIEVVIIRVGGRYYGSGGIYDDDMFETYVQGAAKAGLKIGVYFFSQAINSKEAIEEADFAAAKMAPYKKYITLPVYMDYEWNSGWGYRLEEKGGTKEERTQTIRAFCDEIKKKGYTPGFYSFDYMLGTQVDAKSLAETCSIWIAHWGVTAPGGYYTGKYDSWQYSSTGEIDGISGDVDLDIWYLPASDQEKETEIETETEEEDEITGISENVTGKDGVYLLSSVTKPGYVVTVGQDGNLTLEKSTGKNNQRFIVSSDSNGRYRIVSFQNGQCLDCEGGGIKTGTNVRTLAPNNKVQQTWLLQTAKDGAFYIVAYNSGRKLAFDSKSFHMQLGTREKTTEQAFRLSKVWSDTVEEGWYEVQCASAASYALDVSGGSKSNGGNIQIYKRNGTAAQKFYVQKMDTGDYRLMSAVSGRVVDVSGGSKAENGNIQQYEYNTTEAQMWLILKNDDGSNSFFCRKSNKCLTAKDSLFANKTNVQQNTYWGQKGQKFKLVKKSTASGAPVAEGRYYIVCSANKGFALNVADASLKNGANVRINKKQNTASQQFILSYLGNGYYALLSSRSGKAVDVKGGNTANKTNVQQYQVNGTPAQIWKIRKNTDGTYSFINQKSSRLLDVSGGKYAQNTNIWQYTDNKTAAQKFVFVKP